MRLACFRQRPHRPDAIPHRGSSDEAKIDDAGGTSPDALCGGPPRPRPGENFRRVRRTVRRSGARTMAWLSRAGVSKKASVDSGQRRNRRPEFPPVDAASRRNGPHGERAEPLPFAASMMRPRCCRSGPHSANSSTFSRMTAGALSPQFGNQRIRNAPIASSPPGRCASALPPPSLGCVQSGDIREGQRAPASRRHPAAERVYTSCTRCSVSGWFRACRLTATGSWLMAAWTLDAPPFQAHRTRRQPPVLSSQHFLS